MAPAATAAAQSWNETDGAAAAATTEWLRLTDDGERKSIQGRQRLV